MSKKVGICLIGSGRAGMIHANNFNTKVPNAEMVAVCDPVEEAAKKACEQLGISTYYLDYKEALKDDNVDAVVVASPTKYHKEIVVAAANAGKDILCEKPMAMNVEECDVMIKEAKYNNVKLQIAFMRRFDEGFMQAKEIIDSGEIGEVVLVKSLTRGPSIPKPWMYDISKSNGPLAEVNSHDIDAMRWLAGSEFKTIYGIADNYRAPQVKEQYPDYYDNVIMAIQFENGVQGLMDGATSVRYGYDARAEVLGTEGCIFIGGTNANNTVTCSLNNGKKRKVMNSWMNLFKDAYTAEDVSFIDCIINDQEPKVTGHDGKMAVKIVEAGMQSIKTKKVIDLNKM
ncbi:Gfo/Idh/MocA family oxidoreductase [Vallitalea sp.]|jgi:myo-inositol 2-dehydrogenase/D-chiro-inositol 1-dehydrogenase/scyllo-inositol 2-dehydrogenase (NAD+)|uniref:Gfo/Idh/MocA family oxidoreductase n=1 Tax=Vallitalea sp. TaxID=1882829 RepID=UPI0025EB0765|nr:Gfo/Idh/MocA family oxidoreductase [Vallitalea sp.]MCT4687348.1 Gfo/Idh/MocA family oxidoreductase [Vallitalea sp.]